MSIKYSELLDKMEEVDIYSVSKVEFAEWLSQNVVVFPYLYMSEKESILYEANQYLSEKFMSEKYGNAYDFVNLAVEKELIKNVIVILHYTDIDISEVKFGASDYDLFIATGFHEFVTAFCNKDYEKTIRMVDECNNISLFSMVSRFADALGGFPNADELNNTVNNMSNMLDSYKGELEFLNKVQEFNNPELSR